MPLHDEPPPPHADGASEPPDTVRTAFLGRYDDFEAELILEILRDAGIFAYAKHDPRDTPHDPYPFTSWSDRGVVLVDAEREDEARRLIQEMLPQHLESIRRSIEEMETSDEPQPPWGKEWNARDGN